MATITFDTLKAVEELEAAGMDARHAKAVVNTVAEAFNDTVATKADIAALEARIDSGLAKPQGRDVPNVVDSGRRHRRPDCRTTQIHLTARGPPRWDRTLTRPRAARRCRGWKPHPRRNCWCERPREGETMKAYKPIKEYPLPPIPKGHQIYATCVNPAGIKYYRETAIDFVKGSGQKLLLKHETDNPEDPNAIKIVGVWTKIGFLGGTKEASGHIGYIPGDIAAVITEQGVLNEIQPRLRKRYLSERGFVEIELDITGPKTGAKAFKEGMNNTRPKSIPMNHLPRVIKIQEVILERADYESQFQISLRYSDDQGELNETKMDVSDAIFLHGVTLLALQKVYEHVERKQRKHIDERLHRVYPEVGSDMAKILKNILEILDA